LSLALPGRPAEPLPFKKLQTPGTVTVHWFHVLRKRNSPGYSFRRDLHQALRIPDTTPWQRAVLVLQCVSNANHSCLQHQYKMAAGLPALPAQVLEAVLNDLPAAALLVTHIQPLACLQGSCLTPQRGQASFDLGSAVLL
jgi:hypothetical protein